MMNSLERVENYPWNSRVKIGFVGLGAINALLEQTPVSLTNAVGLAILALSTKLARSVLPKSLQGYIFTKAVLTVLLAAVSAVAISALFGFPMTAASIFAQAFTIALPTILVTGAELMIAYARYRGELSRPRPAPPPPKPPPPLTQEERLDRVQLGQELRSTENVLEGDIDFSRLDISCLPDNLIFEGNLDLSGCKNLTALPRGLVVNGSLNLRGCSQLNALPSDLQVSGNVDLEDCTGLRSLPYDFEVQGNLNLQGCKNLSALPWGLHVGGSLNLRDCTALKGALPDRVHVGKDLNCRGCTGLNALPLDLLEVNGHLNLRDCTGFKQLPEGLKVHGNLDLGGCTSLKELPEDLKVDKDLNLNGCTGLETLPETLNVDGSLNLTGCTAIKALPADLEVGGDLILRDCSDLSALPEGLKVKGDLHFPNSKTLTMIPESLKVEGAANFSGCTALRLIPDNFEVGKGLDLSGCIGLTSLPKMKVGGDLSLRGCSGLGELPAGLHIDGNLALRGCKLLKSLPEDLHVGKNLILMEGEVLTALPKNLFVGGDLNLSHYRNLRTIGERLRVNGNLSFRGCSSLEALPDDLQVGKDFDLSNCIAIEALRENVKVGRNLVLTGCTRLSILPESLQIGGDFDLSHCTGLTFLPNQIEVGGHLNFQGCSGITALPNWVTELGRVNGEKRRVNLEGMGLSYELSSDLKDAHLQTMDLAVYLPPRPMEASLFGTVDAGLQFWMDRLCPESGLDKPKMGDLKGNERDLCWYLTGLVSSEEYRNLATRPFLADRVIRLFNQMATDPEITAAVIEAIKRGKESKELQVIRTFDQMEVAYREQLDMREGTTVANLKEFAAKILRLNVLKAQAKELMRSLHWVDEIEVVLTLQTAIQRELALPLTAEDCTFRGCAHVSDEQIAQVKRAIQEQVKDADVDVFLKTWGPEKVRLRREQVTPYDDLTEVTDTPRGDNWVCPGTYYNFGPHRTEHKGHPVIYNGRVYNYAFFKEEFILKGKIGGDEIVWTDLRRIKVPDVVVAEG